MRDRCSNRETPASSREEGSSDGRERKDGRFRRTVSARRTSLTRRAAILTSGVALTAGCLRLSGEEGDGDGSPDDGDGEDSDGTDESGESVVLEVLSATGTVNSSEDAVSMVTLTVRLGEGSSSIDLTETAVEFVSESGDASLVHASSGDSPAYYLEPVQADDESDSVLSGSSDRYLLKVPFESAAVSQDLAAADPVDGTTNLENTTLSPLGEGETARVSLTPVDGRTTDVPLTVPQTLVGSETVAL